MGICEQCGELLIEIDLYGERLTGCVECNRWGRIGDKQRVMELKEDDLAAVRERVRCTPGAGEGAVTRCTYLRGYATPKLSVRSTMRGKSALSGIIRS